MANSTVRRFCFTWNSYTNDDLEKCKAFFEAFAKYGIVGKELAPTTGLPHLQGFCTLNKPMRFSAIKKHLHNSIHIEKANGSDEQNQKYCSKTGDFYEKGSPSRQGSRTDLQSVVDDITTGKVCDRYALANNHPIAYIKYQRGLENYLKIIKPIPVRDFKTDIFYYWGPPGTGKSRRALEEAQAVDANSIYYKPRGLWWDGYAQQTCVIIDDFYGWIKYDEMLKIMDRYPYKVQIKGGFEEFTSKKIWITSNVDTDLLYRFVGYNSAAFERRITKKVNML